MEENKDVSEIESLIALSEKLKKKISYLKCVWDYFPQKRTSNLHNDQEQIIRIFGDLNIIEAKINNVMNQDTATNTTETQLPQCSKCLIVLGNAVDKMAVACGHIFCKPCALSYRQNTKCPKCPYKIKKSDFKTVYF